MDENQKKQVEQANQGNLEKGKEAVEKFQKVKNIKVTLTIMAAKAVAILMLVFCGFFAFALIAGAVKHIDLDEYIKTINVKEQAIGEEALDTILTLEDGKYKINYNGKTGTEAIREILEENGMKFESFTDEEIECLYKCLKAEWATTYPNLGGDVDNKDLDSEYVQGVITVKRASHTKIEDGKTQEKNIQLTYKPYEEFSAIKDSSALNYFSLKDGNIIVASWSTNEIRYELNEIKGTVPEDIKNQYVNTGEQITITETAINYKAMTGIHTVPFEFLLALLINTDKVDFVNELSDIALDSTIEITIYDNTTEIITTEKEHIKEITTYKKDLNYTIKTEYQEQLASGNLAHGGTTYSYGNETFNSAYNKELEYELTKTTISKSNSYVVGLTNVSSWLADITNEYSYLPEYGEPIDLGAGNQYTYGPEVNVEEINPPTSDSEIEAFRRSKESASTSVDASNGATHITVKTCSINTAKKEGTLNGSNTLEEYTSITNKYKYEKGTSQTSNVGGKFKEVYDKHDGARAQLDCVASWLYELLEETESGVDYVSVMKYLLYVCTGEDHGVTELDLDLFKEEGFTFVGTIQGDNAYQAFLLAWEGTRKDESGNFILHRPNDVTIGYGLYLKYNLGLFQELGYFTTLNQSTWESTLYEIRRQRVVNKEDLKFYNYELNNGQLVRKEQIPNADIEQASKNSRSNFREGVEKEVKFNLSPNQYDALAVIKYKWGNIGNFNDVYHYYEEGDKDKFLSSFVVNGINPMSKKKDFSERQYAAWIMFDEGRYLDRSGNEIAVSNSATQESHSFLDVAKERHDYIRTNNYSYVNGTTIPADASRSKGIDCSAYVSDVIYWYGYYNGYQKYVDTFKGHQHVSSWFMSKSNVESMGWKQLPISQVQAGDLIVKSGHIEIYAGDGKCYNAGSTEAIRREYSNSGMAYVKGFTYAIRIIPPNTGGSTVNNGNYKEVKNGREIAEYARNQKFYQGANQSKWGDSCLGFSIVYGTAIKNNDQSLITRNKSSLTGNSPVGTNWPKEISNNSKQEVLANVYDQINRGKPCIIQVNGNTQGTSRHYVVVIGYKSSVTSRDTIKETDLLIIDVWDAKVEEVGTKGSGKRFMISGWDTGRTGSSGYGYQMYILN